MAGEVGRNRGAWGSLKVPPTALEACRSRSFTPGTLESLYRAETQINVPVLFGGVPAWGAVQLLASRKKVASCVSGAH